MHGLSSSTHLTVLVGCLLQDLTKSRHQKHQPEQLVGAAGSSSMLTLSQMHICLSVSALFRLMPITACSLPACRQLSEQFLTYPTAFLACKLLLSAEASPLQF